MLKKIKDKLVRKYFSDIDMLIQYKCNDTEFAVKRLMSCGSLIMLMLCSRMRSTCCCL